VASKVFLIIAPSSFYIEARRGARFASLRLEHSLMVVQLPRSLLLHEQINSLWSQDFRLEYLGVIRDLRETSHALLSLT
jgi:hypothetical protein